MKYFFLNTTKLVLALLILSSSNVATLNAANTNLNLGVNEGSLSVQSPSVVQLNETNLDNIPDTGAWAYVLYDDIVVRDHRSIAPGWSATATLSDFTDGTYTISADSNTAFYPIAITPIGNSSITGVTGGPIHYFTGPTDPTSVMTATNGNGKGRYKNNGYLALFIDVSTAPGSYVGVLTLTVS